MNIENISTNNESIDSPHSSYTEESFVLYNTDEEYDEEYDEEIADEINEYDNLIPYIDCKNKHYYLGAYCLYDNTPLFAKRINLSTFYKYNYFEISSYMFYYSSIYFQSNVETDIIQLEILPDDTYMAIVKTFWIKIIQRTWKRIFKQRKLYVLCLKKAILSKLQTFQYTNRIEKLPGLRGMLYHYDKGQYDKGHKTEVHNYIL